MKQPRKARGPQPLPESGTVACECRSCGWAYRIELPDTPLDPHLYNSHTEWVCPHCSKPNLGRLATVAIKADGDTVRVTVGRESLTFEAPGMLTGCDLRDVLEACGIRAGYEYTE